MAEAPLRTASYVGNVVKMGWVSLVFGLLLLANGIRHFVEHDPVWGTAYLVAGSVIVGEFLWRLVKRRRF